MVAMQNTIHSELYFFFWSFIQKGPSQESGNVLPLPIIFHFEGYPPLNPPKLSRSPSKFLSFFHHVSDWTLASHNTIYDQSAGHKQAAPEPNECNVRFTCFEYIRVYKHTRLTRSTITTNALTTWVDLLRVNFSLNLYYMAQKFNFHW